MPAGKRILILSSWYPSPGQPHLGNFVQRQAELLAEDHEVFVIQTLPDSNAKEHKLVCSVKNGVREMRVHHPIGKNFYSRRSIEKHALDIALAKLNQIDLLWTQIILPKGWQFYYVSRQFNCKWVHFESGSYFRSSYRKWKWTERAILKTCMQKISAVYSVSEIHKVDLSRFIGSKSIEVIPNHIDCNLFSQIEKTSNETTQFLHISTLDANTKDPQGIFEACKILHDAGESFTLSVVCDEDFSEWERIVNDLNINSRVHFIGATAWEDLPKLYQTSDAFILNSTYESFSIVLAEALSTGTPVISTPVGIGANLPPTLGLQSEISNPKSLASQMKKIIHHQVNFDQIQMRKFALQFDKSTVKTQLNKIVNEHTS